MNSSSCTRDADRENVMVVDSPQSPMAAAPHPATYCLPDGKEITVWIDGALRLSSISFVFSHPE